MEGAIGKFIAPLINFLLFLGIALGLSDNDVFFVVSVAFIYSIAGLVFSTLIPELLHKKGVIAKEEMSYYETIFLVGWIVAIFLVIPLIVRGGESWK